MEDRPLWSEALGSGVGPERRVCSQRLKRLGVPVDVRSTVASQSVDNSASKAVFSINAGATVGGMFITTDNTKGGTTGILISVGAFTGGDRTVASGDTINATATLTASG